MASVVEPGWLVSTSRTIEHRLDDDRQTVRAMEVDRYDALTIAEHPVTPDPQQRRRLIATAWRERGPDDGTIQLLRRARFIGVELDVAALSEDAAASARRVDDIDVASVLPWELARRLETGAPVQLPVPSGRTVPLTYKEDGTVMAAVKLQELFGLAGDASDRSQAGAGHPRTARAQRPAGANDARPPELLGPHLPGGEEGAARALPPASLARRSVDGHSDPPNRSPRLSTQAL